MKKAYGLGSITAIPGKKGFYYFTKPLGGSRRSKKIVCKSLADGIKKYEMYVLDSLRLAEQAEKNAARLLNDSRTVRNFLETEFAKADLAGTSRHLYESTLTVHVYRQADFCALSIDEVSNENFKSFLDKCNATQNTKNRIYKHLKWYFTKAVEDKRLKENPIFLPKADRPKANKSRVIAFSQAQEIQLLKFAMNDATFAPIVIFLLDTGCRSGEMLGLKWDKVHFDRKEVDVHRTLDMVDYKCSIKDDVKSPASYRTLPLSKFTLDTLKALKTAAKAGSDDFVFQGDEPNGCWNRYKFTRRWNKLVEQAGLSHFGIHTTRHTVACRLLRSGMYLPSVAARLGHASADVTLKIYSHAMPSDGVRLATEFDRFAGQALNLPANLTQVSAA